LTFRHSSRKLPLKDSSLSNSDWHRGRTNPALPFHPSPEQRTASAVGCTQRSCSSQVSFARVRGPRVSKGCSGQHSSAAPPLYLRKSSTFPARPTISSCPGQSFRAFPCILVVPSLPNLNILNIHPSPDRPKPAKITPTAPAAPIFLNPSPFQMFRAFQMILRFKRFKRFTRPAPHTETKHHKNPQVARRLGKRKIGVEMPLSRR
jgi:hypothetical protein